MFHFLLLAAAAATAPAQPHKAPAPVTRSSAAERDLQCLTLTVVAAGMEKDETKRQSAIAESWYYVGRLDVSALGTDLKQAMNRALATMQGQSREQDEKIGEACDSQFTKRAADLRQVGESEKSSGSK